MALKFNKDLILKHRFWILLAVTLPLVLFAIFVLATAVGAEIDKERQRLETTYKDLNPTSVVGPKMTEEYSKYRDEYKASEGKVHAAAFQAQEEFMFFPEAFEKRFNFKNGLFATEIKIIGAGDVGTNGEHLLHGEVLARDDDSVTVKPLVKKSEGEDGEKRQPAPSGELHFFRTANLKVTGDGKDLQHEDINAGQVVAVTYYKSKYYYDEFTINEQNEYVRTYLSQIHPILRIVDPVDEKGNGVVQFKGWLYNRFQQKPPVAPFFTYVSEQWKADVPIYKEAWAAQEDLWIQKELFRVIREANDSVARFKGEGGEDKSKEYKFTNPNFELKMKWEGDQKLVVTVANQLSRRQKLDVNLRIKFNKIANEALSIETLLLGGEYLDPKGFGDHQVRTVEVPLDKTGIQRTGIYAVEQVLTWETAPVKRIDQISLGSSAPENMSHSSRTLPEGSQPYRKEETKEVAAGPMAGDQPMGSQSYTVPNRFAAGPAMDGQGQRANLSLNGLLLDRYMEVSEQSRRVPIGVALIVDQDHVDRVLTAFNNSKLRFLTTQVLLSRYPTSVRPQLGGATAPGATPEGGDAPATPMFYARPPGDATGGPMSFTPMGYGQPQVTTGVAEELENNAELVIYGVATLYERYPKRKIEVGNAAPAEAK